MTDVRVERVDPGGPEAVALVTAYVEEIATTFPSGFDPAASVSADPDELRPPRGAFLVVRDEAGAGVGCGGVKLIAPTVAEVKRMWVSPELRGRGIGRLLLDALEAAARELGAEEGRLDTNGMLTAAIGLYESAGWVRVAPYNDNGYATHWYAKSFIEA